MAFWHQLGTKPIGKRVLLLPEPRPGPPADPKIICHPEAGNTKYIPLSGGGWKIPVRLPMRKRPWLNDDSCVRLRTLDDNTDLQ